MAKIFSAVVLLVVLLAATLPTKSQNQPPPKSAFVESLNYLYRKIEAPQAANTTVRSTEVLLEWINQKLDHYDPNSPYWLMRYISNGEFHKPNGPIFIFLGGEGEISDGFVRGGVLHDMAREHCGYLFTTEHRFYGKSIPTSDLSIQNLKYLTSQQALADLAHFIRTQKAKPEFANSKVILASGSYPGALTVWAQHLYPDLVQGSWASSAPLLAKPDFPEYKEVVGEAIRNLGGEACYNRFYYGIRKLEEYVDTKQVALLKSTMRVCDNFNAENWLDVAALFSSMSNVAAGLVQNHNNGDIQNACQQIMSAPDDVTGIVNWYYSQIGSAPCYDYTFGATVGHMKDTVYRGSIWRQWTYQLCNEFGYSQTSKSYYQPFGTKYPVQYYENICSDVYGITRDQFWANAEKTNHYYGGLRPNVKNVFYSHGSIDPWHPAGIQQNDDGVSCKIPWYAHCKDFNSMSSVDTPEMKASKEKVQGYVRRWLGPCSCSK